MVWNPIRSKVQWSKIRSGPDGNLKSDKRYNGPKSDSIWITMIRFPFWIRRTMILNLTWSKSTTVRFQIQTGSVRSKPTLLQKHSDMCNPKLNRLVPFDIAFASYKIKNKLSFQFYLVPQAPFNQISSWGSFLSPLQCRLILPL